MSFPALEGDLEVDVAVVGAGITGVTVAHLLKREGKSAALLEMRRIGLGTTGNTTAKLTVGSRFTAEGGLLQGPATMDLPRHVLAEPAGGS